MRKRIYFRLLFLLALLIAFSAIVMSVNEIRHNRRSHQEQAREQSLILARQLAQLLMWDDRLAARELLMNAVTIDRHLAYAFIERKGRFYIHTFPAAAPQQLLDLGQPGETMTLVVIRDEKGRVMYDIAVRIEPTKDILHLGVNRLAVDRCGFPALTTILILGLVFFLLIIYPARRVAAAITCEIDQITGQLVEVNTTLETRVTERTAELAQVNKQLSDERKSLTVTLSSIGDGVITTDVKGRINLLNRVAEGMTGWKQAEARGRPLDEVFHVVDPNKRERVYNPFEQVLRMGSSVELENHMLLISRDGGERVIADSGAPIRDNAGQVLGVVLVFRDVTETERAEREQQRVEKLESIGVLAGGIAHDFNNLLAAILGNLSLARLEVPPTHASHEFLENAEIAVSRAKDLAFRLLTFAKGSAPIKTTCSMEVIVRDAARFALSGSKSECQFAFEPGLPAVEMDAGQISQVLHNLLLNADQAMEQGGAIRISGKAVVVEGREGLPLVPGNYVCVSVEDHGVGIPERHLIKLFDPYFTTKPQGSGLGLAVVHSIIKNHRGHITVSSQVGKGTTFSIYLPACVAVPEGKAVKVPIIGRGKGRVLVMDDEGDVREVLCGMLKKIGYETEPATQGDDAMARCLHAREQQTPYDLFIFDLTIRGGKGGVETLRRLRQEGIQTPAIAASGYSLDPVMSNPGAYGFAAALPKPCPISELARVTQQVMASA